MSAGYPGSDGSATPEAGRGADDAAHALDGAAQAPSDAGGSAPALSDAGPLADASALADAGPAPPACFEGDAGCTRAMSMSDALAAYPGWTRVMSEPEPVALGLESLCRIPTGNELAFIASLHGSGLWLQYWLSPLARALQPDAGTYLPSDVRYPVGAAIVKEKFTRGTGGALSLVALGAMIKQPPGFDPAHGDWEFGYWEPNVGWHAAGETAKACGDCHETAQADRVFLDLRWHLEDAPLFPGVDAGRP